MCPLSSTYYFYKSNSFMLIPVVLILFRLLVISDCAPDQKRVRFLLYNNNWDVETFQELYSGDVSSVRASAFDKSIFTIVMFHGLGGDRNQIKFPIKGHLEARQRGQLVANILVVDYGPYAGNTSSALTTWLTYKHAVGNLPEVGRRVTIFLLDMVSWGMMRPSATHLVAISLGSQLAGLVGQYFQDWSKGSKLKRITGMDPAGPCFGRGRPGKAISKNDAEFVDVIHTDWNSLGTNLLGGHVDFIVNTGKAIQPGCETKNLYCSHRYVFFLYTVSLAKQYIACQLPDGTTPDTMNGPPKICQNPTVLGPYISTDVAGVYHVNSTLRYPDEGSMDEYENDTDDYPENWSWLLIPCKPL